MPETPPPSATATLYRHEHVHSRFLDRDRDVVVWVPPGYDRDSARRYPVLYMHDGQNLFEPDKAFVRGEHWRVGETASALIEQRRIEPLIIVGIYNTGKQRMEEYTHTHDRRRGGGEAQQYRRFIIEELKPLVDRTYRTRTDAEHTGMAGSSLGGLVTLYIGLKHPEVFSKLAVMSPSVWWDRRSILKVVRDAPVGRSIIWLDMGTRESAGAGSARRVLDDARLLKVGLEKAGWIEGANLHYEEVQDGTHSERAWGDRFGRVLEWLYPVGSR